MFSKPCVSYSICWSTTFRSRIRILFPLCEINTIKSKYNVWPGVLFLHLVKLMRPSPVLQTDLMVLPRIFKLLPTYSCDLNRALTLSCLGITPRTWQGCICRRRGSQCGLSAGWERESWGVSRGHDLYPWECLCHGKCNFCQERRAKARKGVQKGTELCAKISC